MAFSTSAVDSNFLESIVDVTATADGDTGGDVPHGLSEAPDEVVLIPLDPAARISLWTVGGIDATNVTLACTTDAGSGTADPQLRVISRILRRLA